MSIDIYSILSSIPHNPHYLERYIKFIKGCKQKNLILEGYSEYHHICPRSLFPKYESLSKNRWNGIHLTARQHFIAHWILWKTYKSAKMCYAFMMMCNFKNHKISSVVYEKLKINNSLHTSKRTSGENNPMHGKNHSNETKQKISKSRLEVILINNIQITKAKFYRSTWEYSDEYLRKLSIRMSGYNNPSKNPNILQKIRNTKSSTFIDGKNLDSIGTERAADTMKKEFINESGEHTTIYKENGKKLSNTLLQIESNGKTKAYNKNKLIHEKLRQKGKWYKVKNVFDSTYEEILAAAEVRNISPGLEKCTKEKYLGKSEYGKTMFRIKNKEHLIGLYVELIEDPSILC